MNRIRRMAAWAAAALLLVAPGIRSVAEVAEASRKAESFCLERGQDARTSNHIALCIEEMAGNVIEHGFPKDEKDHHLSVRITDKDGWTLRFRDDCVAFDPLHFVPEEAGQGIGIRLVTAMTQEAYYTYSINLNNLVLKFPKNGETPEPLQEGAAAQ